MDSSAVAAYLTGLQATIVGRIEQLDGAHFRRDHWQRAEGGGGTTCILEGGELMEREIGRAHV